MILKPSYTHPVKKIWNLSIGLQVEHLGVHWEQFMRISNCLKIILSDFVHLKKNHIVIFLILQPSQTYLTVKQQSFPSYSDVKSICYILSH